MVGSNVLKEKAAAGKPLVGAFVNISAAASVEVLALAGLDYVIIDTEHGPFDVNEALPLILAAEARGIVPWVRVRATERPALLKMLDAGAQGLMIPYIKSVEQAESLVSWGKYRPLGDRGYGFTRSGDYGHAQVEQGGMEPFFAASNQRTLLIPQCETRECLELIESIVGIDGIDGIFVGPVDLSIALGFPGQFEHPAMLQAFARVLKACQQANKLCFTLANTAEEARVKLSQGYHGVASTDLRFLSIAAAEYVQQIRR